MKESVPLIEIIIGLIIILLGFKSPFEISFSHKTASMAHNSSDQNQIKAKISFKPCFILLTALFAFLLFFKVDEIPIPYHVDEAGMLYDALCLNKYGVDRYLYRNPVYFINFGDGQNALYTYLALLMIRLFGDSILSVRLPAILLSLLAAVCLSLLIRKEHGNCAALICMGLFCILPFSIMHSRWALESYLFFPMMIFSCTALYRSVQSGKIKWFILSGSLFGITLYTYAISYPFLILFFFLYLLPLFVHKKIRWKQISALGIPVFLLAIPLLIFVAVNMGFLEEIRTPFLSFPKLQKFRSQNIGFDFFLNNVHIGKSNLFYKILFDDTFIYNTLPKFGTVYPVSRPLLLFGCVLCIYTEKKSGSKQILSLNHMMMILFTAAILVSVILEEINVNRASEIFIPLIYFLTLALWHIFKNSKIASIITAGIYLVLFSFFIRYYFTSFPNDLNKSVYISSLNDLKEGLDYAESLQYADGITRPIYVIGKSEPHIYTLLAKGTDPYTYMKEREIGSMDGIPGSHDTAFGKYHFMRFMLWDGIPENQIYIFRNIHEIPWRTDLLNDEVRQFGSIRVYYPRSELIQ